MFQLQTTYLPDMANNSSALYEVAAVDDEDGVQWWWWHRRWQRSMASKTKERQWTPAAVGGDGGGGEQCRRRCRGPQRRRWWGRPSSVNHRQRNDIPADIRGHVPWCQQPAPHMELRSQKSHQESALQDVCLRRFRDDEECEDVLVDHRAAVVCEPQTHRCLMHWKINAC